MAKEVYLVAGLAYGDEGKGATVDWLARTHDARLTVRYNGGSQASHTVVIGDGWEHSFAQFGSSMFNRKSRTHLSKYMLVNPLNMLHEAGELRRVGISDAFERTTAHKHCLVITPFQRAVNRIVEWHRGDKRHGSCGQGVGQTRSDHLQYGSSVVFLDDLSDRSHLKEKLAFLQEVSREEVRDLDFNDREAEEWKVLNDREAVDLIADLYDDIPLTVIDDDGFENEMRRARAVIFEGAQGVLLDEKYGAAPYNTWTDTTFGNAAELLSEVGLWSPAQIHRIGVLRSYFTRHGAGPLTTEDDALRALFPEKHNSDSSFQGKFRVGCFDMDSVQYALEAIQGVDEIAMNHLDHFSEHHADMIQNLLNVPITIRGFGPKATDRKYVKAKRFTSAQR